MKCRGIVRENGNKTVVWFGSYGLNEDGTAKFANEAHESYTNEQQGVADSLTQRLSVIEGELWYDVYYGIPLLDKDTNKAIIDMNVANIINQHPDVQSIIKFESRVVNHKYTANIAVQSVYGELSLTI